MAITLIGTPQAENERNGNDVTLTFDGSPIEDDLSLLLGGHSVEAAGSPFGVASGYTELAFEDWTADENCGFGIWYKFMGATPDTDLLARGSGNTRHATAYTSYMLRGVDLTTVEDAAETFTSAATNHPDHDAITTITDGAWVFAAHGGVNNALATVAPSGYSNMATEGRVDTVRFCAAAARKEVTSAGSEDPGAYTHITGVWKGYTIAIRPAGIAAGSLVIPRKPLRAMIGR